MNHKTKVISILLFCCSLVLSGYTACYAEVEPFDMDEVLKLEDAIPLDSAEAQSIMNDAFQRSNGAADAYTWDASGFNSYGYDPYALDYEISNLTDYQLDDYYENLDFFDGDPYAAYNQLPFETNVYGPDGSDLLPPVDYWDGQEVIGAAEEFDVYEGLEAIGGNESAEEFLNNLGIDFVDETDNSSERMTVEEILAEPPKMSLDEALAGSPINATNYWVDVEAIRESQEDKTSDFYLQDEDFSTENILTDSSVLVFGDDHTENSIRDFIGAKLPELKQQGVTQLGMESLESTYQDDLDTWDEQAKERVRERLQSWNSKGPGVGDSYFNLIDDAKESGMRVVGLEHPDAYKGSYMGRTEVNPYWADVITKNLPNGKMAVLAGSGHLGIGAGQESVSGILNDNGVPVSEATFTGFQDAETIEGDLKVAEILGSRPSVSTSLTLKAREDGIQDQTFMVPTVSSNNLQWLIHLPQGSPEE